MDSFRCLLFLGFIGTGSWCQTTGSANPTPSPPTGSGSTTTMSTPPSTTLNPERGVVVSVSGGAHVRHIPIMPGYESGTVRVPGIGFYDNQMELLSIDVDYNERKIFMYDTWYSSIVVGTNYSARLEPAHMDFKLYHIGISYGFVQLVVDWLSKTLYWVDSHYRWIVAAPTDTEKMDKDYYKIIVDTNLEYPDGIALDPYDGLLFWSDNGKHPKIERSNLQGKGRLTLVSDHLYSPWSLEADQQDKRLYWIDAGREEIMSVKYDGSDRRLLARVPSSLLWDIGIFKDIVIVTDVSYSSDHMAFFNKTTGKTEVRPISFTNEVMYSLAVYHQSKQPPRDTGDTCGQCDQMCLSTNTGSVCACSEGYTLNTTTNKCDEAAGQFHRALVMATPTHICLIDIRTKTNDIGAYDPICVFTVIQQSQTAQSRRKRQATEATPTPANPSTPAPPASTPAPSSPQPGASTAAPTLTQSTAKPTTAAPTTTTTTPAPTAAPGDKIKLLDINMVDRVFYYVDVSNRIYERPIDLPIESDAREEVASSPSNITGLVYDWEDRNLYWCDDNGRIFLFSVGDKAISMVTDALQNPEQLVIMPRQRKLAWLAKGNKLQTMAIGDTRMSTFATDLGAVRSLTVNPDKNKFVWLRPVVNGTSLMSMTFDDPKPVAEFEDHPYLDPTSYLLTVYKEMYTWVHLKDGQVQTVTINTDVTTRLGLGTIELPSNPVAMKVLDASIQSLDPKDPCSIPELADCQHICVSLYVNDKFEKHCKCRQGFTVDPNNPTRCVTNPVADNFILVTDTTNNEIHQIDLDKNQVHNFEPQSVLIDEVYGVFYNPDQNKIIWSDKTSSVIYNSNIDGTDPQPLANLGSDIAYRFAYDRTTRNLYFTTYYFSVGVLTASGEVITLIDDVGYEPLDIVVHPEQGYMFISVDDVDSNHILRANMDGTNLVKIVETGHPDGLAIDYVGEALYYADRSDGVIYKCAFNGTCSNFHQEADVEFHDIATDGEFLYIADYKKNYVVQMKIADNDQAKPIGNHFGGVDTIYLHRSNTKNVQPASTGCQARNGLGDCSTICLPTPQGGRTCTCQDGIGLKDDLKTCADVFQCDEVISQSAFVDVTLDTSCLRHLHETCQYNCPRVGYNATVSDRTLTCTNIGWTNQTDILCQETKCPETINNGQLPATCSLLAGDTCAFTCKTGYVKTLDQAVCTNARKWHNADTLCKVMECPRTTLTNGQLSACDYQANKQCGFQCYPGFEPSQNQATVTCGADGKWGQDLSKLCVAKKCSNTTLTNGNLGTCTDLSVGKSCPYTCADGYTSSGSVVVCLSNYSWHPTNACVDRTCLPTIPNGHIVAGGDCTRRVNSTCRYACLSGYEANISVIALTCTASLSWNKPNVCTAVASRPDQSMATQPDSGRNMDKAGFVAAVVVMVIIIVILVAVIGVLFWRRRSDLASSQFSYARASFRNGGAGKEDVAIENPGYQPSGEPKLDMHVRGDYDDHLYSGIDPSQMNPVSFDSGIPKQPDDGFVNPMYANTQEPLPAVAHVDLHTAGKDTLTLDENA